MSPEYIAHHLVDRLHVGTSDRQVIKFVLSRMLKRVRTRERREERHEMLRLCLKAHHANRAVFNHVTRGI